MVFEIAARIFYRWHLLVVITHDSTLYPAIMIYALEPRFSTSVCITFDNTVRKREKLIENLEKYRQMTKASRENYIGYPSYCLIK